MASSVSIADGTGQVPDSDSGRSGHDHSPARGLRGDGLLWWDWRQWRPAPRRLTPPHPPQLPHPPALPALASGCALLCTPRGSKAGMSSRISPTCTDGSIKLGPDVAGRSAGDPRPSTQRPQPSLVSPGRGVPHRTPCPASARPAFSSASRHRPDVFESSRSFPPTPLRAYLSCSQGRSTLLLKREFSGLLLHFRKCYSEAKPWAHGRYFCGDF